MRFLHFLLPFNGNEKTFSDPRFPLQAFLFSTKFVQWCIVKYYTSMSLVFYSISRRASLRESKQNQQEVHDQEVEAEAEAEAVSRTKNRTKS